MRAVLLAIVLALPLALATGVGSNAVASPDGRVALSADAAQYAWPDHPFTSSVCFTMTNVDAHPVWWGSSPPFSWIEGPAGQSYMNHGAFFIGWTLDPGESFTRCWGGGTGDVMPVCAEPGVYTVFFQYSDEDEGYMFLQLPFSLVAPGGAPTVGVCPIGDLTSI